MTSSYEVPEAFLAAAREFGLTIDESLERGLRLVLADHLPLETLTPRVKRSIVRAAELAGDRGHEHVGTEHLLLALLEDDRGIAGTTLAKHGAQAIRDDLLEVISAPGYQPPPTE